LFKKNPSKKGKEIIKKNPLGFDDLTQMFALKLIVNTWTLRYVRKSSILTDFFTKKELFKPILWVERDPQVSTAQSSASFLNLQLHWKKGITGAMPHS